MKFIQKILTLFILTILTSIYANAQIDEWKTIIANEEGFTVEMPTSQLEEDPFAPKNEKYTTGSYSAYKDQTYFFISIAKFDEWKLPDLVKDLANENEAKKEIFLSGSVKGNKYVFGDTEGFYHTVANVSIDKWKYVFHIVSEIPNNPDAERVINSIKFRKDYDRIEKSKNVKEIDSDKIVSSDGYESVISKVTERVNSENGKRNGIGTGSGSGRGIDNTKSNPQKTKPKPVGPTTGIKILSKPKPGYTELARLYNIKGNIRIKVVFLSDGSIGHVIPINKLPFGLTNNAINVTRQIKFIPPMKNGVKYSIRKTVIYNFTIY